MAQIILDISSNTHKNDESYYKRMIDELVKVDTRKHEVVLKWQLFEKAGDNRVADVNLFCRMAIWAYHEYGYKTTASVFDRESLNNLIFVESLAGYELPFIKIANDRSLDWLIGEIPRRYKVYQSVNTPKLWNELLHWQYDVPKNEMAPVPLYCVSKYPSLIDDYPCEPEFISDHTVGLDLWHRNKPLIWEKHYKLPDSTGLDAGPFAITPEELRDIL